ncbi:MAG: hypothetical protein IJ875_00720 [Solobacterium sp.]|nr:hypothetical protein [Solobacterium sp.]
MNTKGKSYTEMKKIVMYIGGLYKRSKKRADLMRYHNVVEENRTIYDDDAQLLHLIDRTLQDCNKNTALIIRKDYLDNHIDKWHEHYFARSTYYRLKRTAIQEFLEKL